MGMIDTSQWKEFRVGDWFQVSYGKFIPKSKSVINGFPHVTTSAENNGYSYNVSSPMFPAGSISVASDGSMGATFYHEKPYSAGNIVSNLVPNECVPMNKNIGLFIATLIKQEGRKYSWSGFKFSVDRVRETRLYLPATPSGEPDWAYIDSFMSKILEEEEFAAEQLAALAPESGNDGHFLDVSGWKTFRIGDLFNVCTTKSLDKLMLDLSDEYEYAYVGRTGQNNGILGYLKRQDFEPNEADTFSVVQIGEKVCCYQTQAWYATQNIFKLKLQNHVSKNASLFLSSIITNTLKFVFGNNAYTSYPTKSGLENLLISLPVTPDGQPDWAWMEQYMQQQMNKAEGLAEHLVTLE